MAKQAILIIDIQNDFTGDNAKFPVDKNQAVQMINNLNRLMSNMDLTNMEIVYIGNEYSKWNVLNVFRNFAAIKGTDGSKQDGRLHILSKNYFSKTEGNSFSNPKLDAFLKEKNINKVFISGLYAEACIYATVRGAVKNKYTTTVLSDCVATKSDDKRVRTLREIEKLGAEIVASDALFR